MIRETSKAIAGALAAGATAFAGAMADGKLTVVDVVIVVGALAAGYLGVYLAPKNRHVERVRIGRRRRVESGRPHNRYL